MIIRIIFKCFWVNYLVREFASDNERILYGGNINIDQGQNYVLKRYRPRLHPIAHRTQRNAEACPDHERGLLPV